MPQAKVRMIRSGGATFIEIPNVDFNGREILVRVFPTDDPGNVAIQCMSELVRLKNRNKMAPISSSLLIPKKKIIKPN